jgi:hypothetical protein
VPILSKSKHPEFLPPIFQEFAKKMFEVTADNPANAISLAVKTVQINGYGKCGKLVGRVRRGWSAESGGRVTRLGPNGPAGGKLGTDRRRGLVERQLAVRRRPIPFVAKRWWK